MREALIAPIKIYRRGVSPILKPHCIYYPTCSEYFELAVRKYGILKGTAKGLYRVLRCNPFASGGYDPP